MISIIDVAQPVFDATRSHSDAELAWQAACVELGVELSTGSSPLRKSVAGYVNGHEISISLVGGAEGKGLRTQYSVRFDAPHAPPFFMVKRFDDREYLSVDTGNPYFDAAVASESSNAPALAHFLADDRRSKVLHLLHRFPDARITNHHARVWSEGIEENHEVLVSTVRTLTEIADSFDPAWVEVELDERSVLADLFDSARNESEIKARFEKLYLGSGVNWTGEIIQVGDIDDRVGRRVAVLVGSADGQTAESGRVVALTVLDPELSVARGDIVSFDGALLNLDPKKRMFRVEDATV